jgi:hypothetical protein
VVHQIPPTPASTPPFFATKAFTPYLTITPGVGNRCVVVKDKDVRARNVDLCGSFQSIWQKLWLDYQGLDVSCLESMSKFIGRM